METSTPIFSRTSTSRSLVEARSGSRRPSLRSTDVTGQRTGRPPGAQRVAAGGLFRRLGQREGLAGVVAPVDLGAAAAAASAVVVQEHIDRLGLARAHVDTDAFVLSRREIRETARQTLPVAPAIGRLVDAGQTGRAHV